MDIAQTVRSFRHDWLTPVSVTETEIREELQFHLDMCTADNMAAGMDPDQAVREAQARFGDFENNFRACRKASLGMRIIFQRVQLAFMLLLLAAVACLVTALLRTHSQYESELQALRSTIQANQRQLIPTTQATSNQIPVHQWCLPVEAPGLTAGEVNQAPVSSFVPGTLNTAWCDWRVLDEEHE